MKTLTIYIPTFERFESCFYQYERLMDYLSLNLSGSNWLKIIIANNASKDERYNYFRMVNEDNFYYFERKNNIGISGAIIEGFRQVDTDYLWVLSDDDVVDFEVLNKIKETIANHIAPTHIYIKSNVSGDNRVHPGYGLCANQVIESFSALSMLGFISTNIYSYKVAKEIESGYMNACSYFPHVAMLLSSMENDNNYNCTIIGKENGGYYVEWVPGQASYGGGFNKNFNIYLGMLRLSDILSKTKKEKFISLIEKDFMQSHYIPISLVNVNCLISVIKYFNGKVFLKNLSVYFLKRVYFKIKRKFIS